VVTGAARDWSGCRGTQSLLAALLRRHLLHCYAVTVDRALHSYFAALPNPASQRLAILEVAQNPTFRACRLKVTRTAFVRTNPGEAANQFSMSALACCQQLRTVVTEKTGGLNRSTLQARRGLPPNRPLLAHYPPIGVFGALASIAECVGDGGLPTRSFVGNLQVAEASTPY
jgi:hypothetical protein